MFPLKVSVTGAPPVSVQLTTAAGSVPAKLFVSTRLVTYNTPSGRLSTSTKFVIVDSGTPTVSRYVTTSPISTFAPVEFVSLVEKSALTKERLPTLTEMFVAIAPASLRCWSLVEIRFVP